MRTMFYFFSTENYEHLIKFVSFFSFQSCLNPLRKNGFEEYFLFSSEFRHIKSDESLSFCFGADVGIRNLIINSKRSKKPG